VKLKLDDKGNVVVQEGKPVYLKDDGSEVAFDVAGTVSTIARLNGEAKGNRERAEAAESKLKGYDGINDPEAARKALGVVANLDQKKLIDSGEVEKFKGELSKAYQAQLDEAKTKLQTFEQQLYAEKVGGAFSRSKFIAEKLDIPADFAEARFGKAFAIEEGRIVAKDQNGNKLYSASNPGELASFDEALSMLVQQHPDRERILKSSGASGYGSSSSSQGTGGKTNITRAQFESLSPMDKAQAAQSINEGKAVLTA
jgi:hypothetical protein